MVISACSYGAGWGLSPQSLHASSAFPPTRVTCESPRAIPFPDADGLPRSFHFLRTMTASPANSGPLLVPLVRLTSLKVHPLAVTSLPPPFF